MLAVLAAGSGFVHSGFLLSCFSRARATDSPLHMMQRDAPYMQMTAIGAGWPVVVLGVVVVAACAVCCACSGGPLAGRFCTCGHYAQQSAARSANGT